MSVEDITKRIIDDAKKASDKILDEARVSAARIIDEAKAKAKEKSRKIIAQAEMELKHDQNKKIVRVRIISKNNILKEKQNLLNETFNKAIKTLLELNNENYKSFLISLIKKYIGDGEELIFSQKDLDLGREVLKSLNGDANNIKLSTETREILGGFISKKGDIETNLSFEALIENKREEYQAKLVKMLNLK